MTSQTLVIHIVFDNPGETAIWAVLGVLLALFLGAIFYALVIHRN